MATGVENLTVFKKSFNLAMRIFEVSKKFPKSEIYSLTNQVRRSSRSVCTNLAEGYRKRLYEAHFVSKISDSDMENTETQVWLKFSFECGYISRDLYIELIGESKEIGKLLGFMIKNPHTFR